MEQETKGRLQENMLLKEQMYVVYCSSVVDHTPEIPSFGASNKNIISAAKEENAGVFTNAINVQQ